MTEGRSGRSGRARQKQGNRLVQGCDLASELAIYVVVAVAPWFFAATSTLAFRIVSVAIVILGLGQIINWALRRKEGALPEPPKAVRALFCLNLIYIGYIAVSIVNARATFNNRQLNFTYFEAISWLPTTYDRASTIEYLAELLSMTVLFWGGKAWLTARGGSGARINSGRLQRLLWVVIISAAFIAIAGLVQRAIGTLKILFIFPMKRGSTSGFYGPFPYRGNATQFLNMVWPVALGFWRYLAERRPPGKRDGPELLLLPLAGVILGSSLASLSRTGMATTAFLLLIMSVHAFSRRTSVRNLLFLLPVGLITLVSVVWVAGPALLQRFQDSGLRLSAREYIYENSLKILADYPIYGVGAGAFPAIYHSYRGSYSEAWQAYAHNDWLEAIVTTGAVGFALQLLLFCVLLSVALRRRSELDPLGWSIVFSLLGCCLAVVFDFGFQIYAVLILFTCWAALLTTLAPAPGGRSSKRVARESGAEEEGP